MTIMTHPEDDSFKALLEDYAAPLEDNGFTNHVMKAVQQKQRHMQRVKFAFLAAGSFTGGIIAAGQMPRVWTFIANISLPANPLALAGLAALFAFIVWATLDNKAQGLA